VPIILLSALSCPLPFHRMLQQCPLLAYGNELTYDSLHSNFLRPLYVI
jgi:hypothetical protein